MDASNLIKPALANGDIKCIGSTTYTEFRGVFEKDRALARRFQKIDVPEPSIEESYLILKGLKSRFEEHHNVKYTLQALRKATELASRYINDRHLPDKIAMAGKIDPLIGRDNEINRIVQTLCRRRKNNPLLVGEAGVGKTAIAEGLARKIVEEEVPDLLLGSIVYSLDLGALVAGTMYRGDFEKRLKSVINQLAKEPGSIVPAIAIWFKFVAN